MKNITKLTAAVAIALSASAANASLFFDPDGTGGANGTYEIAGLDWNVTSFLADGGNDAVANWMNLNFLGTNTGSTSFNVYAHGTLQDLNAVQAIDPAINPAGLGTDYEITFIMGFSETVSFVLPSSVSGLDENTAFFSFNDSQPSFFKIFYDTSIDGDQVEGSGFDDGVEILSSVIDSASGGSFTVDLDPTTGNQIVVDLDKFNDIAPGWDDAVDSVQGHGVQSRLDISVDMIIPELVVDPNFFKGEITELAFSNLALETPFTNGEPSRTFSDGAGGTIVQDVGAVNGQLQLVGGLFEATNPDFMGQVDPNMGGNAVPAPATLALMGLGLLGLAGTARRRKA